MIYVQRMLFCQLCFRGISPRGGQLHQQFVQGSHDPYGHAHEQTLTEQETGLNS